jgi:curved DNA-binding protein CbpA
MQRIVRPRRQLPLQFGLYLWPTTKSFVGRAHCSLQGRPFTPRPSILQCSKNAHKRERYYFTNAQTAVLKDCPYAALGLQWGATNTEIKEAYRKKCRQYHPDVLAQTPMSLQERETALQTFQHVQTSYDALMKAGQDFRSGNSEEAQKYSFQVWRMGDTIAQNRTDVAGALRKRPAPPLKASKSSYILGQPDGSGVSTSKLRSRSRGEYLTDGGGEETSSQVRSSSTVGTGRNKWTTPPKYTPFTLDPSKLSKHYYKK